MAYAFKSKSMQALQAKKASENSASATEIAKMRLEVERLKRKVEVLTGERGTGNDKAVLMGQFEDAIADYQAAVSSFDARLKAIGA